MKTIIKNLFITFICLSLLNACTDYKKAEIKGMLNIPAVTKFNTLFTKKNHKIGARRAIGADLNWCGNAIIYGRYIIAMRFNIEINSNNSPKRISKVIYHISEKKYEENELTGVKELYRISIGKISQEEWVNIKKPDDIFKLLKITPIKDKAIKGIEEAEWELEILI